VVGGWGEVGGVGCVVLGVEDWGVWFAAVVVVGLGRGWWAVLSWGGCVAVELRKKEGSGRQCATPPETSGSFPVKVISKVISNLKTFLGKGVIVRGGARRRRKMAVKGRGEGYVF